MNQIPKSFFADMDGVPVPPHYLYGKNPDFRPGNGRMNTLLWYDSIIDDLISHPGTLIKECARRLGRHPTTIGLIIASDMFKVRYKERRDLHNEMLHERITEKLTKVAEAALDHTLTALEKKRDNTPLPLLHEIAKGSLDRLGYAPQQATSPPTVINNNILAPGTVSPAALERARSHLKELQTVATRPPVSSLAPASQGIESPLPSPSVAGPKVSAEVAEGDD